jgi:DNA (cytosine-5)-methyltransferase 1
MTTFGSVCSGIEAASVAWHPLGWRAAWLSEIEPFPSAVLKHHYPDVPNLGDMTNLPERILSGEVEAPDVFCGGTPCQAFSVAGLRRSLDDARGNLSLTFCEIANAIDHIRRDRGDAPAIIFWENVPGVLSTKDNAFGCFLAGLAGEDDPIIPPGDKWTDAGCVFGPERAVAWRVLDAQYFGLAQRRRRVFVVASARDGFDPAKVLFEFDGLRRDTAPSREAGKDSAVCPTLRAGGNSTGGDRPPGTDVDTADGLQVVQPYSVVGGFRMTAFGEYVDDDTASAMKARDFKDATDLVAHSMRGEGFDASEDGTGRGTPLVPVAFHNRQDPDVSGDITHPLGAKDNGMGVMQPVAIDKATAAVAAPIGFIPKAPPGARSVGDAVDQSPTITTHQLDQGIAHAMQVRRLTPVECERLQGFPAGYTAISWRGKPADQCPDGPRYKALGNSWAVPVVRWIGARINAYLSVKEAA